MSESSQDISSSAFANYLGIDVEELNRLARSGVIYRSKKKDKFVFIESVKSYIAHIKTQQPVLTRETVVSSSEMQLSTGIRKSQLSELETNGHFKKVGRGQFLLIESLHLYHDYLRRGHTVDAEDNVVDYNQAKTRKMLAEADRAERANEIEKGEYVELSQVKHDISDAVGVCANILNTLKLNIGRIAPQMPNRAMDLVGKECAKALTAIIELDEDYQEREVEGEPLNVD